MTPAAAVQELRRQAAMRNATWPCVLLSRLMPLCDAHDAMRTALLEARAFIAAERQSFVECSTTWDTHEMDPDDFDHAEHITNLLARIDAALGAGSETWID